MTGQSRYALAQRVMQEYSNGEARMTIDFAESETSGSESNIVTQKVRTPTTDVECGIHFQRCGGGRRVIRRCGIDE